MTGRRDEASDASDASAGAVRASADLEATLRPATPADVEAIATLHLRSWRATYDPLLTPADRARLTLEGRLAAWRRRLAPDAGPVIVAERAGRIVGFVAVTVGVGAHEVGEPGVGTVPSIHVAAEQQRTGLGRRLLEAGVDALRAAGCREATLWVLSGNRAARGFYEALGWRLDGAVAHGPMGGMDGLPFVDEVRYRRRL